MITFPAFYGHPERKAAIIARITGRGGRSLLALLSGAGDDLAQAHEQTGFTAPLIAIANAVFTALPATDARRFAQAFVEAAPVGRDMAQVAEQVHRALITDALTRHGRARLLAAIQHREKAEAKKARRRASDISVPDDRLVTALAEWAERETTVASPGPLHRLASLEPDGIAFHRRCGALLIAAISGE